MIHKVLLGVAATALLVACARTNYQQYEGRNGPQIVEGQGGTKEVLDGYEIWGNGTPPRRYVVLGVVAVEDFDNPGGNMRIRSALAAQIKAAGGNAAVIMDSYGGGQAMGIGLNSRAQMAVGTAFSKKSVRWQIVKYVD